MDRYKKNKVKSYLSIIKSIITSRSGECGLDNIYHASIQRTGSQWIKSIFEDNEVKSKTGMEVYPQFRYEWGEFVRKFPKNMFIPGLYIPYPLYEEIDKPENYKTIYVLRDPREVISSWYYSMKYSHEIMGKVGMHRKRLKSMSEKKGITYCIKRLQIKMSFVRSWVYNSHDPNVIFVKFENLTNERVKEWKKLFSFLKINIDKSSIKSILNKYTKEKMRKSMKENKRFSHYTKNRKSWEKLFGNNHIEMFKKVNGNIVKMLDYSW